MRMASYPRMTDSGYHSDGAVSDNNLDFDVYAECYQPDQVQLASDCQTRSRYVSFLGQE